MTEGAAVSGTRPFPGHWKVRPFVEALRDATGGNPKIKASNYLTTGTLPVIDQGQSAVAGYTDDTSLQCRAPLPCILFGDHTKVFKYADRPFALGADGVKVLVPGEDLDARFAFHYLRRLRLPDDTGYSRHFKFLSQCHVPVPPLSEQQRIAAILDKADAIRRKRQETIALAEELLRSMFLEMFGDPITNPKRWRAKPIREVATVTTGSTPPRENPAYYGDSIEWIKSDNINTRHHFVTTAAEGLSAEGRAVGRVAPVDSTLITCIAGSPDCIGNAALTDREVAFNQQINALTPNEDVDPHFLYVQVLLAKRLIQTASTNSMKGMVSKGRLEGVGLIVPPEHLQRQFGHHFRKLLRLTTKAECFHEESEQLFGSLVQRAFRGEL